MGLAEFIGFAAGAFGMLNALPQVRRVRALGHGEGVSIVTWALTFIVNASWCGYGIRIASPSIIITNIVAGILSASVLIALLEANARVIVGLFSATAVFMSASVLLPAKVVSAVLVALTLARLPQMKESYRSWIEVKPTAVSFGSLLMSLLSLLGWETFAVLRDNTLMLTTTTIALVLTLTITSLEIGAGRRYALQLATNDDIQ